MHTKLQCDHTDDPGCVGRGRDASAGPTAGRGTVQGGAPADNQYRAVVESAFDAVVVIDRHSLIVGWNPSAERIFGYTSEEVLGRDVAVIIPARYAAMHEQAVRAFNPERQSSRMHGRVVELTATRKGGKEFPIELTLAYWREDGESYFAGIVRDTTERKRAEEAIRDSEERFRQLAGAIGDVFWLADTVTGDVLYVSPAFERVWGRPPEPEGERLHNWLNVIHPDDRAAVAAALEGARRGEPFDVQCRFTRADGSARWARLTGGPSYEPQGPVRRIAGLVTDMTEPRRIAERLRNGQKMEAVGRLAGGVAHDFNNLLTVILGCATAAAGMLSNDDPAREMISEAVRAAGRAADLTRQLLAFGRKQVVAPQPIDLNAALGEMNQMLARLVGRDVGLSLLPGESVGVVQLDAGQLDQIVMNLVINARDATPHGGRIVVETAAVRSPPPGAPPAKWGYVRLVVSDTGAGMRDEVRSQMFEPFFTTKSVGKGVGLGLATVYAIVTQAGGWIDVASAVGKGTRVAVYLPRHPGQPGAPAHVADLPAGHETVLVAEDEEGVRRVVVAALKGAGYTVLEAPDGRAAMSLAGRHTGKIDLLLTDVVMPGVGGRELAEWLKAQRPSVQLIYMSGHTEDETVLGLVQAREAAFLQKPFVPAALLTKVREILGAAERVC